MSKVYEVENQVILRVPPEIAKKINETMAKGPQRPGEDMLELYPYPEKDENEKEPMRFQ
jgi:hypothetical protein